MVSSHLDFAKISSLKRVTSDPLYDNFFAAAINAGKIISFWNLPHLSYSSPDPELANKEMYTTLVRMISPFNGLGSAMVDIFHYYDVSTFQQNLSDVCARTVLLARES